MCRGVGRYDAMHSQTDHDRVHSRCVTLVVACASRAGLGAVLEHLNNHDVAIVHYSKALSVCPDDADIKSRVARVQRYLTARLKHAQQWVRPSVEPAASSIGYQSR